MEPFYEPFNFNILYFNFESNLRIVDRRQVGAGLLAHHLRVLVVFSGCCDLKYYICDCFDMTTKMGLETLIMKSVTW